MQLELLRGYPDYVGRRMIFCGWGHGPESYDRHTHDPLANFAFQSYYDVVFPAVSSSGRFIVYGIAKGVGARLDWALKWVRASGEDAGEEVEDEEDLSEETVQIGGFAGRY